MARAIGAGNFYYERSLKLAHKMAKTAIRSVWSNGAPIEDVHRWREAIMAGGRAEDVMRLMWAVALAAGELHVRSTFPWDDIARKHVDGLMNVDEDQIPYLPSPWERAQLSGRRFS